MIHFVSFSGGRTSAFLVNLLEQKRKSEGWDVKYVFMETGAEHPKTYDFIRKVTAAWNIDLICLRVRVCPVLGKANSYEIITPDKLACNLQPWKEILKKYGTPYFGGAFCTRTMKIEPFNRFRKDYAKGEATVSWLGIRCDEPKRIWGEKEYSILCKAGFQGYDAVGLYKRLNDKNKDERKNILGEIFLTQETVEIINKRIEKIAKSGQRFLAEISDFEKPDVLNWWQKQPFDLEIPEHLGNCVFCIKKMHTKIALAIKQEPLLYQQFAKIITSPQVRKVNRAISNNKIMYRNKASIFDIKNKYDCCDDNYMREFIGKNGADSGSCSESCEAFIADNDDMLLIKSGDYGGEYE